MLVLLEDQSFYNLDIDLARLDQVMVFIMEDGLRTKREKNEIL
jgi:hypothetical protein